MRGFTLCFTWNFSCGCNALRYRKNLNKSLNRSLNSKDPTPPATESKHAGRVRVPQVRSTSTITKSHASQECNGYDSGFAQHKRVRHRRLLNDVTAGRFMLPKAITSFRKWPSSIRLFDEQRYRMLPHIEKERSDE